jgi:AmmeMemoRadiSam system protein A
MDVHARRRLLDLARVAIRAHLGDARRPDVPLDGDLGRPAGAFVTIRRGTELRGCIGHIEAEDALAHVVVRAAVAACSADPRFPVVTINEFADLWIEISVLGALERVNGPTEITVGRDGLVVERGWRRGLLLPQVAVEHGWNATVFLAQTCHKAGLPADAWCRGARVWRFEAEVFGE